MSNRNSFIESTKETDERLEALKQLYPEIFSDGKINLDAFKDVTGTSDLPEGQDRTPGYYGLYWPGKRAAKQLARKEAEGTLEPVFGDGVNEDTTHNIYIEGDNLEVLRILKQSYKGRVKMIYIDPPYNTGSDFIYPDDYKMPVEEYLKLTGQTDESGKKLVTNLKSNGAFHTDWLNMMYPRLQLARELLTEDGVIFISIDDNEQANLKLLCDDIFGEENFIANIIWQHSIQPKGYLDKFSVHHNFVLCYAKGSDFEFTPLKRTEDNNRAYSNPDNDPKGPWRSGDVRNSLYRPNLIYDIISPSGKVIKPCPNGWRWSKETVQEKIKTGEIIFSKDETRIIRKIYLSSVEGRAPETIWFAKDVGSTRDAINELKSLFDNPPFDTPKPSKLISKLMELVSDNNYITLDFFSGSATTAHAVLNKNVEDGGKRKYIMVQLPVELDAEEKHCEYKNICEIGKERIRRAGAKILEEAKANKDMFSEDNLLDVGFKVYRMTTSNFKKYTPVSGQDKEAENSLFKELEGNLVPLVEGWKSENVLTEIILKQGFALDCTKEKLDLFKRNTVYKITDSSDSVCKKITLYVCLDPSIEKETIDILKLNDDEKFICLDAAIDDSAYARLADKGRIETI